MKTRQNHFRFAFEPLVWLTGYAYEQLQRRLHECDAPLVFNLNAWQARHQWQFEVPLGLFAHDYQSGVTWDRELSARAELFNLVRPRLFRGRDIYNRNGVLYYRRNVLERVRDFHANPEMIYALLAFWNAAERDRTLVKGKPPPKVFMTPTERMSRLGAYGSGPAWTEVEDNTLRRWFGRRTVGGNIGRHTPLTVSEWTRVLDELGRRRSKGSARQRIQFLNDKLRREFVNMGYIDDGHVLKAHVDEWKRRVLGERPRTP